MPELGYSDGAVQGQKAHVYHAGRILAGGRHETDFDSVINDNCPRAVFRRLDARRTPLQDLSNTYVL
jgi:hypothetical protein